MDPEFNKFIENYPDKNLDIGAMYAAWLASKRYTEKQYTTREVSKLLVKQLSVVHAKNSMEKNTDKLRNEKIISTIETIESLFLAEYLE